MKLSSVLALGTIIAPALSTTLDGISDVTAASVRGLVRRSDVLSEILTDIEDLTECTACEALLVVLKVLAHTGNDDFVDVIVDVCEDLAIEDDDVCEGAISREGPILAHDLRQMTIGTKTSELFCLTVFGLCQWPDVDTDLPFTLSTKPDTARPSSSGKTPIQVVQISDIHVDLNYTVGASYNCTKNICCRPYTDADEPGNNDTPAGEYGNEACDSPLSLERSMYDAVETMFPDRAFTIFTGDVVEGAVWLVTDSEVENDLNNATTNMESYLTGEVYPVTGNHDTCPVNSFSPENIDTTLNATWVYETLSADWESWIGSSGASETLAQYGSYSALTSSGLRIISLNTNFWYKENFWLYEATMDQDPNDMLSWLVSELEAAESADERVWILGHMPMGSGDAFHDYSYYFDAIIQRYEATIAALFFGHTHKDEFEISYSDYDDQSASTATMMSYIAGALTPTSGNPTFRVYDIDPETFGVLDMAVYYANVSSPTYQDGPTWEKLYSVKDTYGAALNYTDSTAELTPAFWHNVTVLFEDDDTIFQEYYARKNQNYGTSSCDSDCKTAEICQLRAAQAQYNCVSVTPGVNFKKRSESTSTATGNDCGGSFATSILPALGSSSGLASLKSALVKALGGGVLDTVVPSNYTTGNVTL